jgi:hypothetical protein
MRSEIVAVTFEGDNDVVVPSISGEYEGHLNLRRAPNSLRQGGLLRYGLSMSGLGHSYRTHGVEEERLNG